MKISKEKLSMKSEVMKELERLEKEFQDKNKNKNFANRIAYNLKLIEYVNYKSKDKTIELYYNLLEHHSQVRKNAYVLFISLCIPIFIALLVLYAEGFNLYTMFYIENSYNQHSKNNNLEEVDMGKINNMISDAYINYLSEVNILLLASSLFIVLVFMLLFLYYSSFIFKSNRYLLILKTVLKK